MWYRYENIKMMMKNLRKIRIYEYAELNMAKDVILSNTLTLEKIFSLFHSRKLCVLNRAIFMIFNAINLDIHILIDYNKIFRLN